MEDSFVHVYHITCEEWTKERCEGHYVQTGCIWPGISPRPLNLSKEPCAGCFRLYFDKNVQLPERHAQENKIPPIRGKTAPIMKMHTNKMASGMQGREILLRIGWKSGWESKKHSTRVDFLKINAVERSNILPSAPALRLRLARRDLKGDPAKNELGPLQNRIAKKAKEKVAKKPPFSQFLATFFMCQFPG